MRISKKDLSRIVREMVNTKSGLPGRDLNYDVPHEGKYLKGNCYKAVQAATDLHDIIRDADDVPAWCQVYVGIAAAALGKVRDYLAYKISSGESTE